LLKLKMKSLSLKCHAVTCTGTKVACIKQAYFFHVLSDYFQNNLP
jgi:hypothetical protein